MPTVVSAGADYAPCPAGLHSAVCVDVHDLGIMDTPWGAKHRVALVWAIDELDDRGKAHECRQVFGFSLSQRATLRKTLESWRGRAFTAEELMGFDLDRLIGVQAQVQITHVQKADRTYANVTAVVPASKGQAKVLVPNGYIRRRDREPKPQIQKAMAEVDVEDDASCPF